MNKTSTLEEQVRRAQKMMSEWSDQQRRTVHLQGRDVFFSERAVSRRHQVQTATQDQKSKVAA